jgi:murein tripeptide amidase MpaA
VWKEDKINGFVDLRVDPSTSGAVRALGLPYEVLIDDVQAQIEAQVAGRKAGAPLSNEFFDEYHTYEEINAFVDGLVAQYPNLLRKISIGTTYEGRSISGVRLHGRNQTTKAVMFNGGQHAREWITPATVTGFLYELVTRYGTDDIVTQLVDGLDITIITVLNPDGYSHTWTNDRLWRKNREPNQGSACVGVDTNRNWRYQWNTGGSSSQPCNDAYHGPAPFSTVEASSVDAYIRRLQAEGLEVLSYFDVHAYGQLWMFPWGFTCNALIPDHNALTALSQNCTATVRAGGYNTVYTAGPICQVIYQASGSSADHTYGDNGVKYSFALELRDLGRYGFQLPASQIVEVRAGWLLTRGACRSQGD